MHTTNLRKVGGSIMLAVPPALLNLINVMPTTGVIRCDQPRALDLIARKGRCIDTVPEPIMQEVIARLSTLLE